MKVLVTGGAGFVGSHTVDLLVRRGDEVTVLDSLDPQVHGAGATSPTNLAAHVASGAIRFVHADIRNRDSLRRLLGEVEAVVHLAAAVGVGQSMYQPDHYASVNVGGTALLLDLLANESHHVRKLVLASSMSLYGEGAYRCASCGPVIAADREEADLAAHRWEPRCPTCRQPLASAATPETKPLVSTSIYAATKRMQEEMCLIFGKAYRLPVIALRYFNIYGPRQSLNNPYTGVAAIFLSRLLNGHSPIFFEDGLQSRDFIHVSDIARANLAALDAPLTTPSVFNVGTGSACTVADVARTLAHGLGVELRPTINHAYRAGDIRHCWADASRIATGLGFRAEMSLERGFADLIAWSRSQAPVDRVDASLDELKARNLVR